VQRCNYNDRAEPTLNREHRILLDLSSRAALAWEHSRTGNTIQGCELRAELCFR